MLTSRTNCMTFFPGFLSYLTTSLSLLIECDCFMKQVAGLLGVSSDLSAYCPGPSPSSADTEIKPKLQNLIHDLILYIHSKEPDIEKSILVFLPTYYSLEQQWYQLEPFRSSFEVHILHRSIDTEQALAAMKICRSRRKVSLLPFHVSFSLRGVHYFYDLRGRGPN